MTINWADVGAGAVVALSSVGVVARLLPKIMAALGFVKQPDEKVLDKFCPAHEALTKERESIRLRLALGDVWFKDVMDELKANGEVLKTHGEGIATLLERTKKL